MRGRNGVIGVLAVLVAAGGAQAQAPACAKADFEAVVDRAAAELRALNQKHSPAFQEKLRALKKKRGWSDDQFMMEAAPFVKDDSIDVYNRKSSEQLAKITAMGQEGAEAKTPDCALMAELNIHMQTLVTTQIEKWKYMFGKLEAELGK